MTSEQIEAVAEVIWNDIWGARLGSWEDSKSDNSVSITQTRATARAALEAARTAGPISVTSLEWEGGESELLADSVVGLYHVSIGDDDLCSVRLNYHSGGNLYQTVLAEGVGPNAAKSLAQLNYERRIIYALSKVEGA